MNDLSHDQTTQKKKKGLISRIWSKIRGGDKRRSGGQDNEQPLISDDKFKSFEPMPSQMSFTSQQTY